MTESRCRGCGFRRTSYHAITALVVVLLICIFAPIGLGAWWLWWDTALPVEHIEARVLNAPVSAGERVVVGWSFNLTRTDCTVFSSRRVVDAAGVIFQINGGPEKSSLEGANWVLGAGEVARSYPVPKLVQNGDATLELRQTFQCNPLRVITIVSKVPFVVGAAP